MGVVHHLAVGSLLAVTALPDLRDGAWDLSTVIRTETGGSGIVQSSPCAVEDEVDGK